jgi:hypothetical protein
LAFRPPIGIQGDHDRIRADQVVETGLCAFAGIRQTLCCAWDDDQQVGTSVMQLMRSSPTTSASTKAMRSTLVFHLVGQVVTLSFMVQQVLVRQRGMSVSERLLENIP